MQYSYQNRLTAGFRPKPRLGGHVAPRHFRFKRMPLRVMQGWGASQPEGEREEEYSLTLTFKHLQRLLFMNDVIATLLVQIVATFFLIKRCRSSREITGTSISPQETYLILFYLIMVVKL